MVRALPAAACLLAIGLASCAADAEFSPSRSSVATASPAATEPPASVQASPASPEATAPPELAGRWRRSAHGETVYLTLLGNSYGLQVGSASGGGSIAVDGDRIEFFGSNRCDAGSGSYTWAIEDGRVKFTEVGEDPCGRADYLPLGTWGRADP